MRWVKFVLFFQAVITLIIGMVFFSQLLSVDQVKIDELKIEMSKGAIIWEGDTSPIVVDLKQRYTVAAWVLLIISIMEIIIISRLAS